MKPGFLFSIVLALLTLAVASGAQRQPEPAPAKEPSVTVAQEASLPAALAALQKATGGAVLCEKPKIERQLQNGLDAVPLSMALEELSRSFHLYWVRRERSLALQKRYGDWHETPDLEVETLTAIAADAFRLIHAFAPLPLDVQLLHDQRAFFDSLSPEEIRRLQTDGILFTAFDRKRQELWLSINARQGYADSRMECRRGAQLYGTWKQGQLAYETRPDGKELLWYRYPDPVESGLLDVPLGGQDRSTLPKLRIFPAGASPAEGRRATRPASFKKSVGIEAGERSVEEIVKALEAAGGDRFTLDPYTAARRLFVYAAGATVAEVLAALSDLYGWELRPTGRREYSLRRVSPTLPADARDLHRKLRAMLPPAIYHLWSNREGDMAYTGRQLHLRDLVLMRLDRRKPNWKTFPVTEMDVETQVLLANLLFDRQIRPPIRYVTYKAEPNWWLVAPERGFFGLDGEVGPGKHPLLWFGVRRPDGNIDRWGWSIGTSSLDR